MTSLAVRLRPPAPAVIGEDLRHVWGAHRPFVIVLAAGTLLRIAALAGYFPAVMTSYDAPRFARVGPTQLFGDFWMPAGYPAFLKVVRHLSDAVWFSIALQHLLGLLVGVAVYATLRRLTAPGWVAAAGAAVPLLSGDVLFLEHQFMSDQFLLALTTLAIAAVVHGLIPRVDRRWLAVGGVLVACALLSRSVGLAPLVVLAVVVAVHAPGELRRRALTAGSFVAGALIVLLLYLAAFAIKDGQYLGISDMSGWNLYSRVAPFADCHDFTPAAAVRVLCDPRPAAQRPGPFGYVWDLQSVPRQQFVLGPGPGPDMRSFAVDAVVHQPGDYLLAVATDLARYVEPSVGPQRPYSGQGRELVSFGFRDNAVESLVSGAIAQRYDGTKVHAPGAHTLSVYQDLVRPDRLLLVVALLAAAAGVVRGRGPLRLGVATFGLCALALYVLPTLTVSYDYRYGIPPGTLLTIAGVLGAYAAWPRSAPA